MLLLGFRVFFYIVVLLAYTVPLKPKHLKIKKNFPAIFTVNFYK